MPHETRIETDGEIREYPYCPECAESVVPKRTGAETLHINEETDRPVHCHVCNILLDSPLSEKGRAYVFDRFLALRGDPDAKNSDTIHTCLLRWPELWEASLSPRTTPS